MLTGIRGDTYGLMGHALLNELAPSQMGHGLGMAHHYHALSKRNNAHPHAGDSLLPQAGPKGPNDETSIKGSLTGLLGRPDGLGERRMSGRRKISTFVYFLCVLMLL